MKRLRCSAADRFLSCPSSEMEDGPRVDSGGEFARMCSARHEAMQVHISGGTPDIIKIASKYGVDSNDVETGYQAGVSIWRRISKYFPNARSEVRMSGPVTVGTTDILGMDGDVTCVGDWKNGYSGFEHPNQLLAYASCARAEFGMPRSGFISAVQINVPSRTFVAWQHSSDDIDVFENRMRHAWNDVGKRYCPGTACTFCPRKHRCTAWADYLRSAVNFVVAKPRGTTEELASMRSQVKIVRDAVAAYDVALKRALLEGPIEHDGVKLEYEENTVDYILPVEASAILQREYGFGAKEFGEVLRMSKGALCNLVRSRVEKGKGKAELKLLEDLAECTEKRLTRKIKETKL
jgi:hypothetical protein